MIHLRCAPPGAQATEIWLDADLGADGCAPWLAARAGARRALALIDARVDELHPTRTRAWQPRHLLAGGEASKTMGHLEAVLRALARQELGRTGLLLVAGGGSLGDLGGLAAALYCRGIEFVLVPTTLLAMVDSSVGGKTAVDLPEGKNLVGAIHPASAVVIDLAFLSTLPEAEFRSGLGEVVKVAIGLSAELFSLLEAQATAVHARDPAILGDVVRLALAAKIRVVEADLHERGRRRLLNLGHTLAHALEAHSGFSLPHGVAVARGLHFALDLAARRQTIAPADAARARALLLRYGFAADPLPPSDALAPFVRRDKKAAGDGIHFVLPTGIGRAETVHLGTDEVVRALTT